MATTINYKNDNVDVIASETATIPRYTVKTGTIASTSASPTIHGTNTLFTTELKVGDWLSDPTNYEVRKIRNIASDTVLTVDRPFSNTLTTTAVNTIKTDDLVQEVFAYIVAGGTNGVVDGKTMIAGSPYLWGRKSSIQIPDSTKVDPITFNATSTTIAITTVK